MDAECKSFPVDAIVKGDEFVLLLSACQGILVERIPFLSTDMEGILTILLSEQINLSLSMFFAVFMCAGTARSDRCGM